MNQDQLNFLKNDFFPLLTPLAPDATPKWGVMNGQEMVEHFTDAVKNASGKLILPKVNEGERLEKFRSFLWSETAFRENTKNPLMSDRPLALRQKSMEAAIEKLRFEFNYFFTTFEADPTLTTQNPFFGELDYAGNVQLLHKHAVHHLKQFGLMG